MWHAARPRAGTTSMYKYSTIAVRVLVHSTNYKYVCVGVGVCEQQTKSSAAQRNATNAMQPNAARAAQKSLFSFLSLFSFFLPSQLHCTYVLVLLLVLM